MTNAQGIPGESVKRWGSSAGVSEWLAALTVLLAVLGMSLSSPPLVGPDEVVHQATASYLTVHIVPPVSDSEDYIPGILKFGACMSFDSSKDASCVAERDDVQASRMRVVNYPPLYYWFVGLGQKFAPGADTWMDVGGRVASVLLNLVGLGLLVLLTRRHFTGWGTSLLLVATPMAVFLWSVVNPNGWEITAGMLFAYFFARAWWADDADFAGSKPWWTIVAPVGASAVAFALARPAAFVWLVLLVLVIMLMGRTRLARPHQIGVLAMSGIGVAAGMAWQVTHPSVPPLNNPDRVADPTLGDRFFWLGQIDDVLPDRLRQMVGVLGSLDTPVPQWMVLMLLLGWGALIGFLYARTRVPSIVLLLGFAGTILVPTVLEVLRWNDWPYWWQGRYTLSFTIPFLYLFLLRFGRFGHRAAVLVSLASAGVLTFMVWQNFARYAYGVTDYIPIRWEDPALNGLALWGSMITIAALLIVTAARTWMFIRRSA